MRRAQKTRVYVYFQAPVSCIRLDCAHDYDKHNYTEVQHSGHRVHQRRFLYTNNQNTYC